MGNVYRQGEERRVRPNLTALTLSPTDCLQGYRYACGTPFVISRRPRYTTDEWTAALAMPGQREGRLVPLRAEKVPDVMPGYCGPSWTGTCSG